VTDSGALSPAHSELLFAVWKMETDSTRHGKPITCRVLADSLRSKLPTVQRLIREIEDVSPSCLVNSPLYHEPHKPGRPRDSYRLNQEQIVTFPETAILLIQLVNFPPEKPYRINRVAFERHMTGLGMDPIWVGDRISANILAGYVREYAGFGYIYPSEKFEREKSFIEKLATEYKSATARTIAS
jgi:hypothetical protein